VIRLHHPCSRLAAILRLTLCLMLCATLAAAQNDDSRYGHPLGTISFSGMPDAYEPYIIAGSFEPIDFYVIAQIDFADIGRAELNTQVGIYGWEAFATIPPEMIITSRMIVQPGAINLGSHENWILGLGDECFAWEFPLALVHYTALFTQTPEPMDLVLDLGPSVPTSFPNAPGPGWLDSEPSGECTFPSGAPTKCLRLFAHVRGMRINCVQDCTVVTEPGSWGALKSRY
jgi:hypothetical protein